MSGGNVCRKWRRECSVCEVRYTLTNFMVRWALDDQERVVRTDTHEARCHGWEILDRLTDRRHPHHLDNRQRKRELRKRMIERED